MKAYRKSILDYDDVRSAVDYAREEGLNEGVQKGIAKGRNEGLLEGIQKGVQTIALNCLRQGMSPSEISRITGLSEKEILSLK